MTITADQPAAPTHTTEPPLLSARPHAAGHERVEVVRGARSGLVMMVAVHSTRLGPALGGCRLWRYDTVADAVADALRLSAGMTAKNALAGLAHGGGKAVIMAPDEPLDAARREAAFLDLGDLVASFEGSYVTAEDVATGSADMAVVARRTPSVVGLPESDGGHGDPGEFTARGVHAALLAVLPRIGIDSVEGLRVTVAGFGQVGSRLARTLVRSGAIVTATDVNPARRAAVEELGAGWVEPAEAHRLEADVFVPAGVGGMLTGAVIDELRCRAVVGPANNQLAEADGGDRLAARGILYAPDYVVNAGGVIHLGSPGSSREEVLARIDALGARLDEVLALAEADGLTPSRAADLLVERRLAS
ncbi:Glu/Leu/Phe/Val dehydrogenase family protein [Herbiconiux sp. CPCC 205716]|uniref:Glu/Leu/Phe/Val dehydrogenase family protein n=1 Tax=Herbiconiux gentiana TaxID=2970912 RepID=A0ABT2GIS5_9MICO|nr:Glu/Leu/Phe/Val dehydrogenase dimerization domain-containing protein [Herbiconiux gentiana]MCS5716016.1 Glu/Leu/Phe/Val dehydrogenase family protein [Herbiconiux gentiana]